MIRDHRTRKDTHLSARIILAVDSALNAVLLSSTFSPGISLKAVAKFVGIDRRR